VKILLTGEYSRLHNSLKEGLEALDSGIRAHVLAAGDDFKAYPADWPVRAQILRGPRWRWLRQGLYRTAGFDPARLERAWRLKKILPALRNYDVVQLINPYPFETPLPLEKRFIRRLLSRNGRAFLLASGDDPVVNRYYLEHPEPYNIFTPMRQNPTLEPYFRYSLKYLKPSFIRWHEELLRQVNGVIPTDLDYAVPYEGHPRALPMIPNPVNTDRLRYRFPSMDGPIVIFHGINRGNYWRKGNAWFSEALETVRRRYGDRVEVVEVRNVPYAQYIRLMEKAHIVLDQVFSWDQGYNALEAMAMGKVVFTGAERIFRDYYRLTEEVNINALPDAQYLADRLSELIESPGRLVRISEAARRFIERHHDYRLIARRYLETWQSAGTAR